MTIIGFDVSKNELVGIRTDKSAAVKETIIMENTRETIDQFLDGAKERYPHLTISSEATADYHRTLAQRCLKREIPFRLINPILTKQFTRATIRKKKTDLTDAHIIAKLTLQGEGTLLTASSFDPAKSLSRTASKINRLFKMFSAISARMERILPEEEMVIAEMKKHLVPLRETVEKLRQEARGRIDQKVCALLCSITGIGPTLAPILITEIGDISRFPSGKSLVAYAGLDPRVKQSGISMKRNTKITKRGSPYLRHAAYIAATIAKRHDPELKIYFQKKIKEGKRYKEATVATARKILYRVYAVWRRGTPYVRKESYQQGDA
ncbi:MAG: transposase [Candidatus Colwellbacteria bacterium]|nr:transposase [Candidatus Colwellbacteria bacterium]